MNFVFVYCLVFLLLEESQSQTDRLSLLHSRLQQEAEKIRKWKNVTELELRQKNHQLQEAQQLIEKQQKSLIDIQVLSNKKFMTLKFVLVAE